ncbi:MAG: ankyrin repeat domain-containing protein [Candidatus Scalindua sp.]|nr:ankyrin repeat domain-containing protein [Candidatus Scalindua sp.]
MKRISGFVITPVLILVLTAQITFAASIAELEIRANQGDGEAMYELAEMYQNGVGALQNYVEAHKWYNIASSRGYVKARNARDIIAEKMIDEQLAEAQKLAAQWEPSESKVSETETKNKKQLLLEELFKAIHDSDGDKLQALLDSGADPDTEIFTGVPLLMVAVGENKKPIVEALVNGGADVNVMIKKGLTLLMIAIKDGHSDIAKYLIEQGANLDVISDNGSTALSLAKSKGFDDVVKRIKKAGGKDEQGGKGQIPGDIIAVVKKGDVERVKELLAWGADRNKTDRKGWFPLMFAAFAGHEEIVAVLINSGVQINTKATDGSTALMAATLQGHYSIVKLLLEKGADKTVENNSGATALDIARQKGYDEIAGLLTIKLRSTYSNLSYDQVKAALKKYNFFDQNRNQTGEFINDYELKMINGDDVVLDHITNLMWHQSGSEKNMKWKDAKEWIDNLNRRVYAGYNDWRLPTVEEAASLLESTENDDFLYIDPVFNITQRLIWTGDSFGTRGAWDANFVTGGVIWRFTDSDLHARPVRSVK